VIEVTVEMLDAFGRARSRAYGEPINTHSWDEVGLAAVLAIVERNHEPRRWCATHPCVRPPGHAGNHRHPDGPEWS
jgi:hypothetical protein